MPQITFDLLDGEPPVSLTLSVKDAERFAGFMGECFAARADAERLDWLIDNGLIAHQLSDSGLWIIVTGDHYPAIDGSEHETARNAIDDAIATLAARKGEGVDGA